MLSNTYIYVFIELQIETIVATCYEIILGFQKMRLIIQLDGLRNTMVLYQFCLKAAINDNVGS